LFTNPSNINHTVLLHTGDNKNIKQFFYATMYFLMTGQWGPKQAENDVW